MSWFSGLMDFGADLLKNDIVKTIAGTAAKAGMQALAKKDSSRPVTVTQTNDQKQDVNVNPIVQVDNSGIAKTIGQQTQTLTNAFKSAIDQGKATVQTVQPVLIQQVEGIQKETILKYGAGLIALILLTGKGKK